MKKLEERKVDAITRAILYPWVRESLELLALWRTELQHEAFTEKKVSSARFDLCTKRIQQINSVIDDAVSSTREERNLPEAT